MLTADRGFERIARYTGQPVELVAVSDGAGEELPEQTYLVLAEDGGCWRELGGVRPISQAAALLAPCMCVENPQQKKGRPTNGPALRKLLS